MNAELAEKYYKAVKAKDFAAVEKMLHPDIRVISPLTQIQGKETVFAAIKGFAASLKDLEIRAKFESKNQAVVVYNFECPQPIGNQRSVGLFTFKDNLIACIELFFDGRPFEKSG